MAAPFINTKVRTEALVAQLGNDVRLTFTCSTREDADALFDNIAEQLQGGALKLTMLGKPSSVTKWERPRAAVIKH